MRADDNVDTERLELFRFTRVTDKDSNVESGSVGVVKNAKKYRSPNVPYASRIPVNSRNIRFGLVTHPSHQ